MEEGMMRRRVSQARVGRLATVDHAGHPHVVPVCFALTGDQIITAVDRKPKSTTALRRVRNIRANATVSMLVDQYDEDWEQLWWIRVDGHARIVPSDRAEFDELTTPLRDKYRGQYGLHRLPGPAIVIDVERFVGWSAR